jgi:uncharacterized repeat protein (TIGR01451 family)
MFATLLVTFATMLFLADPAWAQAAITVEKTDDPDPVAEGEILTYTVVVGNTGTAPTTGDVNLTDLLPAGTTFVSADTTDGTCAYTLATNTVNCNLGILADGEEDTVTIRVRPTNAVAGSTIVNTAQATGPTATGPTTDTDQENTRVTPNLTLVKEDSPGVVEVGDLLRYTLAVENRGGASAADVVVVDELPAEVEFVSADADQGSCDEQPEGVIECDLNDIGSGDTVEVEILVRVEEAGTITNTARVFAGDDEEPIDEDTETTPVEGGGTTDGTTDDGTTDDGTTDNGTTDNGTTDNGTTDNGTTTGTIDGGTDGDPVDGPQGDVVDEIVTEQLPNTGGFAVASRVMVLSAVLLGVAVITPLAVKGRRGRD